VRVRELGEDALISRLREIFAIPHGRASELLVPIGDDASVLAPSNKPLVATTDMATENVHFKREWSSPFEIGGKVTVANLSDIAAMGGTPKYLLIGLALTGNEDVNWVVELARGIQATASQANVAIVGGDVVHGESITISIMALGECDKPILRSGARIGDRVVVSSLPGFSRAGMIILERFGRDSEEARRFNECVAAHVRPKFRASEARALQEVGATSMCDVSDGLIIDLERLLNASHVSVEFELDKNLLGPLNEVADFLHEDVESLFLTSGEEHSYIATVPEGSPSEDGQIMIGRITERRNVQEYGHNESSKSWKHWK